MQPTDHEQRAVRGQARRDGSRRRANLEDQIDHAIARNSLGRSLWCGQDVCRFLSEARQRVQAARAMVAAESAVSDKDT
jgi:hypothetical protein